MTDKYTEDEIKNSCMKWAMSQNETQLRGFAYDEMVYHYTVTVLESKTGQEQYHAFMKEYQDD